MSNQSKLLINEPPLIVLPSLAKQYGLERAIIIQQIHYLLGTGNNTTNISGIVYARVDYSYWIEKYFKFWESSTLRYHMNLLEKDRLLIKYMYQSGRYGTVKFVTLNYKELNMNDYLQTVFDRNAIKKGDNKSVQIDVINKKVKNTTWRDACIQFLDKYPNARFTPEWIGRNGKNIEDFIGAMRGRSELLNEAVNMANAASSTNPMLIPRHPAMLSKYLDKVAIKNAGVGVNGVTGVTVDESGKVIANTVKYV